LQDEGVPLAYFRADDRHEIDFVASLNGDRIGIEVTSAKTVDSEKVAKVATAGASLRAKRLAVVHGGLFEGMRQGIRIIPIHRFLSDPRAALSGGGE
jgi:predicted AAA+ superfamily ATPase